MQKPMMVMLGCWGIICVSIAGCDTVIDLDHVVEDAFLETIREIESQMLPEEIVFVRETLLAADPCCIGSLAWMDEETKGRANWDDVHFAALFLDFTHPGRPPDGDEEDTVVYGQVNHTHNGSDEVVFWFLIGRNYAEASQTGELQLRCVLSSDEGNAGLNDDGLGIRQAFWFDGESWVVRTFSKKGVCGESSSRE